MPIRRYTRGYLPHIEGSRAPQFLTWRLADSLPASVLEEWQAELQALPTRERNSIWESRIERHLDAAHGSALLKNPVAARIVQDSLIHGHGRWYELLHWSIMPTHVHALLRPLDHMPLSKIMQRLKGFSSKEIQRHLGGNGRLWQPDYFDRSIRDDDHLRRVAEYIEWNPVKAKLCVSPQDWPYSSANSVARQRLKEPDQRSGIP